MRPEAFDRVIGMRTLGPLVGVVPKAELKVQAARCGLATNKTQHFEVSIAFVIGQRYRPGTIARNGK